MPCLFALCFGVGPAGALREERMLPPGHLEGLPQATALLLPGLDATPSYFSRAGKQTDMTPMGGLDLT